MSYFKASKIVKPKYKPVKVKPGIKPLHYRDRKPVKVIEGGYYYVSFGNNRAVRCVVTSPPKTEENSDVVSIQVNESKHIVYKDELGLTPEEAVRNQVTG